MAVQAPALKMSPMASQLLSEKVRKMRVKARKKRRFFMIGQQKNEGEKKERLAAFQIDTDQMRKRLSPGSLTK